jgi:hypothetical protein
MIKAGVVIAVATILGSVAATAAFAQDPGVRVLRFGNTSGWYYDNRDDDRDFPANGFFPGNFAAHPANAAIGAAGIIGSTPWRSATPYPSQVVIEVARGQVYCGQRNRSYNRASGTLQALRQLNRCRASRSSVLW